MLSAAYSETINFGDKGMCTGQGAILCSAQEESGFGKILRSTSGLKIALGLHLLVSRVYI